MKKIIVINFILIGFLAACKKDKNPANTETPAKAAVSNPALLDSFVLYPSFGSFYETGNKIFFLKNGTVTKLGCRSGNKGTFTVSFWDYETTTLLTSASITVTDSLQYFYKNISPVEVTANKRYVISMNTTSSGSAKDYWIYYRKSGPGTISANIYPFTSGNVTYEDARFKETSSPSFPNSLLSPWNFICQADLQFEYTE